MAWIWNVRQRSIVSSAADECEKGKIVEISIQVLKNETRYLFIDLVFRPRNRQALAQNPRKINPSENRLCGKLQKWRIATDRGRRGQTTESAATNGYQQRNYHFSVMSCSTATEVSVSNCSSLFCSALFCFIPTHLAGILFLY